MNENSDLNSNEQTLVNNSSTLSDLRKAEIIADANIALSRLKALDLGEYKPQPTALAVRIINSMVFAFTFVFTASLILIIFSPDFRMYLENKLPYSVQFFVYIAPVVILGVFVYLIYFSYQRTIQKQFIKQAKVFRDRIEELLRELEANE